MKKGRCRKVGAGSRRTSRAVGTRSGKGKQHGTSRIDGGRSESIAKECTNNRKRTREKAQEAGHQN